MTIQSTVLLGIAGVLMSCQANAQCYRSSPIVIRHSYHYGHALPRTAYRPHLIGTPQVPPLDVAPAPAGIEFGACSHVDELASRLEVLMNELCLDLYYNYSHNIDFHATYTEAYSLYQTARFIHGSVHNFDRDAVRSELAGADALFHHIEDDVRNWTRINRRQVGTLDITAKMTLAEDALHHLMEDVGVRTSPSVDTAPPPTLLPGQGNTAPLPPSPGLP